MFPSKEIGSDKKAAQAAAKPVFIVAYTEGEFVSEMKEAEALYVMVIRYLGIEKTKDEEKLKIVIPKKVRSLLAGVR